MHFSDMIKEEVTQHKNTTLKFSCSNKHTSIQ